MTCPFCLASAYVMLVVHYFEYHPGGIVTGQLHSTGLKIQWSKGWEKVLWELWEAITACLIPVCQCPLVSSVLGAVASWFSILPFLTRWFRGVRSTTRSKSACAQAWVDEYFFLWPQWQVRRWTKSQRPHQSYNLDQDPDLINKNTHPLTVVMAYMYVTQTMQMRFMSLRLFSLGWTWGWNSWLFLQIEKGKDVSK